MSRRPRALAMCAVPVLALMVLAVFDPASVRQFPPCPFHAATGLFCPGCGALRAVHALLQGQLGRAFALNPLLVTVLPLLAVAAVDEGRRIATGRRIWSGHVPSRVIWAVLGLLCLFAVLRNVPAFGFLGPR